MKIMIPNLSLSKTHGLYDLTQMCDMQIFFLEFNVLILENYYLEMKSFLLFP